MPYHSKTFDHQFNHPSIFITLTILLIAPLFSLFIISVSVQLDHHTSESSLIEITQTALLLCSVFLCVFKGQTTPALQHFFSLITFCFLILVVRESDQLLEIFLPHGAWKVPAAFLLLGLVLYTKNHYKNIRQQLNQATYFNGFIIAIIGCCIVFVFSRIAGTKAFWMMFMGDNYQRDIKTLIEEGLELFGYVFMLIGVFFIGHKNNN